MGVAGLITNSVILVLLGSRNVTRGFGERVKGAWGAEPSSKGLCKELFSPAGRRAALGPCSPIPDRSKRLQEPSLLIPRE